MSRTAAVSGRNRAASVDLMSSAPGEIIVDIATRTVIDTSALRVAIASAIDAVAENTHHVRIPVSIHHGTGSKGTLDPSRCRHSAKFPAYVVASSTVAAPSTTIPVVPTYSPMTPTSPSRDGASGSPAASSSRCPIPREKVRTRCLAASLSPTT